MIVLLPFFPEHFENFYIFALSDKVIISVISKVSLKDRNGLFLIFMCP